MTRTSYIRWNDDDNVRFILDQHAKLEFYCASSLKKHSEGRHVAPLEHNILILSQQVFAFFLLSGETTNTNFIACDLTRPYPNLRRSRRDRTIVGFTTTYSISVFFRVLRFSPTNKTDRHDKTAILVKVALNTITHNPHLQRGRLATHGCHSLLVLSKLRVLLPSASIVVLCQQHLILVWFDTF